MDARGAFRIIPAGSRRCDVEGVRMLRSPVPVARDVILLRGTHVLAGVFSSVAAPPRLLRFEPEPVSLAVPTVLIRAAVSPDREETGARGDV